MPWTIEYTDEFGAWWASLSEVQQDDTESVVGLLEARGPQLDFPYSLGIVGSKHAHMRELRVQSGGHPLRIFEEYIPIADRLYDAYLEDLRREGLLP